MSSDTTQSSKNYRIKPNQTHNADWKRAIKFVANIDEKMPITSSQILDLSEHNSTFAFDTELHVNFLTSAMPKIEKPPVYVEYSNNQEHLIYKTKQMIIGELYHITWKGQEIALRKTEKGEVQILELI